MKHRTPLVRVAGISRAFTLIEILVVVIVLGVLAAVAIPRFGGSVRESQEVALQRQIDTYESIAATNGTPTTLLAAWFRGGQFPVHVQNDLGIAALEQVASSGTLHPSNKVLKAGVSGAFWYNPADGIVRARVADQGSSSATLAHYNTVNGSSETNLGNYSGGGGGGGFGS